MIKLRSLLLSSDSLEVLFINNQNIYIIGIKHPFTLDITSINRKVDIDNYLFKYVKSKKLFFLYQKNLLRQLVNIYKNLIQSFILTIFYKEKSCLTKMYV